MVRDTTVTVTKQTKVGHRFYRAGQHVVTAETASALEKEGAKIIGTPERRAVDSKTTVAKSEDKAEGGK